MNVLEAFSDRLSELVAASEACVAAVRGPGITASAIVWAPQVVVTSEQMLERAERLKVMQGGEEVPATLAGRDCGTNLAVLRLERALHSALPAAASPPRAGALAVLLGADRRGAAAARLALVHSVGPAWHSQAGGRIEAFIELDTRLGSDEGGPVLDARGALLGMSAAGPRRRVLVIPAATLTRVVETLLKEGRVPHGFLGVALHAVTLPEAQQAELNQARGAMVIGVVSDGPAAHAGVLQGDILLSLDEVPFGTGRAGVMPLGAERIGQAATLRLVRGGAVQSLSVTIAAHPAG